VFLYLDKLKTQLVQPKKFISLEKSKNELNFNQIVFILCKRYSILHKVIDLKNA